MSAVISGKRIFCGSRQSLDMSRADVIDNSFANKLPVLDKLPALDMEKLLEKTIVNTHPKAEAKAN